MAKRKTKAEKAIENAVDAAYKKHGNGVQVNIYDIGKILDAGRDAGAAGNDIDEAVKNAIAQYRQN